MYRRSLLSVLVVTLAMGGSVAACSDGGSSMSAAPTTDATAEPAAQSSGAPARGPLVVAEVPLGGMTMPTAEEVSAAWAARPAFVSDLSSDGQAAYAFALARPDVLQWLPCYCGCAAMDHRSNLDCFFQRREVKGTYSFEEHASFCDICIQTANMAASMIRDGATMTQIRAAVDQAFGGGAAPGTDTAQPPG